MARVIGKEPLPPEVLADALQDTVHLEVGVARHAIAIKYRSHDVQWYGVFRGTEEDPRECGWCVWCGRDVYDRDSPHHEIELTA